MVRKTRVVITTAGPYTLYGSTLVKVCAENGVRRYFSYWLVAWRESNALLISLMIHSAGALRRSDWRTDLDP